jgi:CBS domain-containing protein
MKKWIEPKAVRDLMTSSPVTVYPDSSIHELKVLFKRYQVNTLPVVDDRGVLRGIVSQHDLLRVFRPDARRWISVLLALGAERVRDLMSRGVIAVEPGESVIAALDLMIATRRRSLPVVERRPMGPMLVGMLSRSDLLPCLTLAADELPRGGDPHVPAFLSPSRLPRPLDRSQGHHHALTGFATSLGGVLKATIARALNPRRWRRREEPESGSAGAVLARHDPLASGREPGERQRCAAKQEAVHAD